MQKLDPTLAVDYRSALLTMYNWASMAEVMSDYVKLNKEYGCNWIY